MGAARKLQLESGPSDDLQQRLGEPAKLAMFAADQYHARSFWGRHPWVTYLLAPLPLFVTCWTVFALAYSAIAYSIFFVGASAFGWPEDLRLLLRGHLWLQVIYITLTGWYVIVVPPLVTAWLLCRTYQRNALDWRWPVVGCAWLAVAAGCFEFSYRVATEAGMGHASFTWDFHGSASWLLFSFLPRFVLAMGIGLLLVKRAQRQSVAAAINLI